MSNDRSADELLTFLRHDTCETHDACALCKDLRQQSIAMIESQLKRIADLQDSYNCATETNLLRRQRIAELTQFHEWAAPQIVHYGEQKVRIEELEREQARLIIANESWHRRITQLRSDNAQLQYALERSETVFLNQAPEAGSLITRAEDILSDKREGLDPFIGVGFMQEVVNALRGGQPPFDALKEINEARVIWAMSCPCACDDCRMLDKLILARAGAAVEKSAPPAAQPMEDGQRDAKRLKDYFDNANRITHPSLYYSSAEPFTAWCNEIDDFTRELADVAAQTKASSLFCCEKYQNLVCNGACAQPQSYEQWRDSTAAQIAAELPDTAPSDETDEPLWTCDECAGPPRPYSEIERCPMGNCKPVRSVSETDAR